MYFSEYIEAMRQSPYIKEKPCHSKNITSFNFTRDAFRKQHWTKLTKAARGLFIDTKTSSIKARGYNKFFAIGERRDTELNQVVENFEYPVHCFVKYNGYLGLCAGNADGTIWCASKSTDEGWYAARFEDLLREALGNKLEQFAKMLYKNNLTATFEVIDPIYDAHIIEYEEPQVILLSLIMNYEDDLECWTKSWTVLEGIAINYGLKCKELAEVCETPQEFIDWYNNVIHGAYTYHGHWIEGFVCEDADNYMVKVKTNYYNYWKSFRYVIDRLWKGQKINWDSFIKRNIARGIPARWYRVKNFRLLKAWLEDNIPDGFIGKPTIVGMRKAFYEDLENGYGDVV